MKNLRSAMCVAGAIIAVVVLVSVFTGCSNENEVTMKEQTSLSMNEGFLNGLRKLSQVQPVVTRGTVGDSVYISAYAEQLSQEYQKLVAQYDIMADLTEEEAGRMHATDEEFEQMALDDDLFWNYMDKCKTAEYKESLMQIICYNKRLSVESIIQNPNLKMNEKVSLVMHQTLKENSLTNASYETPFDDMPATPGDNPLMATYTEEQCEEIFRQAINCCDKQFFATVADVLDAQLIGQDEEAQVLLELAIIEQDYCYMNADKDMTTCKKNANWTH